MKELILDVIFSLLACITVALAIHASRLWAKTPTPTLDLPPERHSLFPWELPNRISQPPLEVYLESYHETCTFPYHLTVTYPDGQVREFYSLTRYQALVRANHLLTLDGSITISRERSSHASKAREASSSLSSEDTQEPSPDTSKMTPTTKSSSQAIPPQEVPSIPKPRLSEVGFFPPSTKS